ncbi:hypothetical protein BHL63_06410 [Xanthomonas alfalfae]|nr:hypothetical protein BHL63_06410 [Xanthomonas alfalfae]
MYPNKAACVFIRHAACASDAENGPYIVASSRQIGADGALEAGAYKRYALLRAPTAPAWR